LIAVVGTLRDDGSIQVNPMWFDWDGELLRLSLTRTRHKMANLRACPSITVCIIDPVNQFRYIEMRGSVERVDDDTDRCFVRRLSESYVQQSDVPHARPDEERVVVAVRPQAASARG
jgi:PPOX class probable F420-dependent enzyme